MRHEMKSVMTFLSLFLLATCLLFPAHSLSVEDSFEQGLFFAKAKQYEAAIKAFSKEIEINPHCTDAYNNRGVAWYHKGDYDQAISDYTKALDINPRYADAYNNRGVAWYHKGEYDQAISDYTKALDINPRYADAYNRLSWVLATCPDHTYRNAAKAVEMAQKAVELNLGANTLDTLAAAYAEAGKFEDAITIQKRAIALENKEGKTEELAEYIRRLNSYRSNKPWWQKDIAPEDKDKEFPRVETIKVPIGRVREHPSLDSKIKFRLKKGKTVSVIETKGDWYLIARSLGWAHQRLFFDKGSAPESTKTILEKRAKKVPSLRVSSKPFVENQNTATLKVPIGRVREHPSLDSKIKFRLKKGKTVSVIETKGDWYLIARSLGWAHQRLFFKSH